VKELTVRKDGAPVGIIITLLRGMPFYTPRCPEVRLVACHAIQGAFEESFGGVEPTCPPSCDEYGAPS
jgi:hypothetical protein